MIVAAVQGNAAIYLYFNFDFVLYTVGSEVFEV